MNIDLIINFLVPLITMVITSVCGFFLGKKRSDAEVKEIQANYTESLLKSNEQYIVEPLKKEISSLRNDVRKLHRAIDRIGDCAYKEKCPVRAELQKEEIKE